MADDFDDDELYSLVSHDPVAVLRDLHAESLVGNTNGPFYRG